MNDNIQTASLRFDRITATILIVVLCVQIVPFEGYGVSNLKVIIMATTPIIYLLRQFFITKALILGGIYWLTCYFVAIFHEGLRFSTLGYLGLFIVSFITYYNLLISGAFSVHYFKRLISNIIKAYALVLVLQQLCMLVGIHNLPIINLENQAFLAIDKLPSLTIEPSHTARILAVAMLCYLRCIELTTGGVRPNVKQIFQGENRWVTIPFLYSMVTMGSGTAFIALGCISIYFIQKDTALYYIPLIIVLFVGGESLDLKQFNRANLIVQATIAGSNDDISEADGSASTRVVPLINTLKMDVFDKNNWIGKGTTSKEDSKKWWNYKKNKISIVDQYGILGLIPSLILLYVCIIRRFLSIETILFVILFGMTLGNVAYVWGAMFMFTAIRYFQVQYDNEDLQINLPT